MTAIQTSMTCVTNCVTVCILKQNLCNVWQATKIMILDLLIDDEHQNTNKIKTYTTQNDISPINAIIN